MQTVEPTLSRLAFRLSSGFGSFFSLLLATFLLTFSYHLVEGEDAAVDYALRAPASGWAGYTLMCLQKIAKEHRANSDPGDDVSLVSQLAHSTVSKCCGELALAYHDRDISEGLSSISSLFSPDPSPLEPVDRSISAYGPQTRTFKGRHHPRWSESLSPRQPNDLVRVAFYWHPVTVRLPPLLQGFRGLALEQPESANIQWLRDMR